MRVALVGFGGKRQSYARMLENFAQHILAGTPLFADGPAGQNAEATFPQHPKHTGRRLPNGNKKSENDWFSG